MLELTELLTHLHGYAAGTASRSDVETWLAHRIMDVAPADGDHASASAEQLLAYSIAESLSALQGDDEEFSHFVARLLRCFEQVADRENIQDILPLIRHHEAFSILISKFARGLISENGFKSIIRKRFPFDEVRPWLEEASLSSLSRLAEAIEREDFARVRSLIALPPA